MQRLHFRETSVVSACILAAAGLALAACGGGSGSGQSSTPTTHATTSAPSTPNAEPTAGAGAIAAIKANRSNALASSATSKVSTVTLTGTNQASVVYTIYVGGQPALKNQHGTAVYQDGVWKVGAPVFCGLLKLENAGSSAGLPSACKA